MSDHQSEPTTTTATAATPSDAWGQPISDERQAALQGYLDQWQAETDHGERKGPFADVKLTGADMFWLAEQSGRDFLDSITVEELARLLDISCKDAQDRQKGQKTWRESERTKLVEYLAER